MPSSTTLIALDPDAKNLDEKLLITHAANRLGRQDDSLCLVSVVRPIIQTYMDFEFTPFTELSTKWQQEENYRQQTRLEEFAATHLAKAETRVTSGNAAAEIHAMCNRLHAKLVIMGVHKHRGIGRILGSTVSAVLSSSEVDVLAVQLKAEADKQREKYHQILVAVDLSTTHTSILAKIKELELDAADITFISVAPTISATAGLSPYRTDEGYNIETLQDDINKRTRTELSEALQSAHIDSHHLVITTGDPGSTIVAKANEIAADLIVIGASNQSATQRWLLGSTTSYVMNHTNSDVYVVC